MIAAITAPDEGEVLFSGRRVGSWSQKRMGYLPEERGLYRKLKVKEQLMYLAALRGVPTATAVKRVTYWVTRFGLEEWMLRKTQELSKGMQQKMQFIAAILSKPDLLILDEPFSGLDPINSELLREIIFELKDDGCTILFASHRMEQVEQLCDDICLIAKGKVLIHGELRAIKKSYGRNTLHLDFEGDDSFLNTFDRAGRIEVKNRKASQVELRLRDPKAPRAILDTMLTKGVTIYSFDLAEPTLNEIFITEVAKASNKSSLSEVSRA